MAEAFNYRSGPKTVRRVPIASGVAVETGDLVMLSSGRARLMSGASDNLRFIGVAAETHLSTQASGSISVYVPNPLTVFEYDLDSSTAITIFDDLQYNAAKTLSKSTTDPIAVAAESKLAATKVLCTFTMPSNANVSFVGDAS